jgi:hypothetical protein
VATCIFYQYIVPAAQGRYFPLLRQGSALSQLSRQVEPVRIDGVGVYPMIQGSAPRWSGRTRGCAPTSSRQVQPVGIDDARHSLAPTEGYRACQNNVASLRDAGFMFKRGGFTTTQVGRSLAPTEAAPRHCEGIILKQSGNVLRCSLDCFAASRLAMTQWGFSRNSVNSFLQLFQIYFTN